MHRTPFNGSLAPLALLVALLCAGLAHAGGGAASYEFHQPVSTLVVDSGAAPVGSLLLSTSAIDFGSVATHTSETRQVLVSNDGTGVLSFTAAPAVTGAAFAAGLTSCANSLSVNASCLTEATFAPIAIGSFSGTLTVSTDLLDSPHVVSLAGTAYNPVSLITATLPKAKLNQAYPAFGFSSLLAVSNEASPALADASWSATGALPAGMAFDAGTATLVRNTHCLYRGSRGLVYRDGHLQEQPRPAGVHPSGGRGDAGRGAGGSREIPHLRGDDSGRADVLGQRRARHTG